MPRVDREAFGAALREFARAVGTGPDRTVILVLGGAGWRTAKGLAVPEGDHLAFLPAYSPKLQPPPAAAGAWHLWPLCDEGVANKLFAGIEVLERAVADRVVGIKDEVVRHLTRYYWWPRSRRMRCRSPSDSIVGEV